MSNKDTEGIRISQVLAGALAAVTAALLGSTVGVAGTVVGAGLASVVSTVGGALYLRSIQRTKQSVRTVRAKVVGRSGGATVLVTDEDTQQETGESAEVEPAEPDQPDASDDRPEPERRRLRWPTLVAGSVLAFALGMLAITGVEWLRGEPLSGGTGTTFGSIVEPHRDSGSNDDKAPASDPSTPPSSTTTTTQDAPESTTNTPPTTSTAPSTGSSTTTTTAPPTTTTTREQAPPGGTIPPAG